MPDSLTSPAEMSQMPGPMVPRRPNTKSQSLVTRPESSSDGRRPQHLKSRPARLQSCRGTTGFRIAHRSRSP